MIRKSKIWDFKEKALQFSGTWSNLGKTLGIILLFISTTVWVISKKIYGRHLYHLWKLKTNYATFLLLCSITMKEWKNQIYQSFKKWCDANSGQQAPLHFIHFPWPLFWPCKGEVKLQGMLISTMWAIFSDTGCLEVLSCLAQNSLAVFLMLFLWTDPPTKWYMIFQTKRCTSGLSVKQKKLLVAINAKNLIFKPLILTCLVAIIHFCH